MRKLTMCCLLAGALALTAQAGTLVDFSAQGDPGGWDSSVGYLFQVNSPISVTELGVYDWAQDGLQQPQQIGLWTAGGVLLTSVFVDNTDPLAGLFRYHAIAPVILSAGQNYVLASQGGEGFTYGLASVTVAPEITWIADRYGVDVGSPANNPLVFPDQTQGRLTPAFFGPNAVFSAGEVPEPASVLLIGGGLMALGLLRRRKR